MNVASRLFGIVGFFLLLIMTCGGSNTALFLDPSALNLVFGGTLALLLCSLGLTGVRRLFVGFFAADPEQHVYVQHCLIFTCLYLLVSGALGTLISFILMLQNLDDPGALGPGMAVSCMPHFYALFGCCCVLPLLFKFSTEMREQPSVVAGFVAEAEAVAEAVTETEGHVSLLSKRSIQLVVIGFITVPILIGLVALLLHSAFTNQ